MNAEPAVLLLAMVLSAKGCGSSQQQRAKWGEEKRVDPKLSPKYMEATVDSTGNFVGSARYGVTWDEISTRVDRAHWIVGSSLKIIDRSIHFNCRR